MPFTVAEGRQNERRAVFNVCAAVLCERGLNDRELLQRCGIVELSWRDMKGVSDIGWSTLRIPYTPDFNRYRFVPGGEHEITTDNPSGAQLPKIFQQSESTSKKKPEPKPIELRYWQPRNTGVRLYMPPIVDWVAVMADWRVPLIVAEGEFKAIAACKVLEEAACGIGGVWNWKPSNGLILPEFQRFTWRDPNAPPHDFSLSRTVYVVFDSDVRRRSDLLAARDGLVWQLADRGANPRIINLPEFLPSPRETLNGKAA